MSQALIERLEKPERKLVLQIMDNQGLIAEGRSMDSFYCGFKLAWELAYELNHFETDRHPFPAEKRRGMPDFYVLRRTIDCNLFLSALLHFEQQYSLDF